MTQRLPGVFVQGASWPKWLGVRPPRRPLAQSNASAAPHAGNLESTMEWLKEEQKEIYMCVYIKYIYTYLLIFVHIYMICVPPTWDRCTNDNCGGVL